MRVSGFWLYTYSVAKGFNWRLFSSKDKILMQQVNMVKFNSVSNYRTNILSAIVSQLNPQKSTDGTLKGRQGDVPSDEFFDMIQREGERGANHTF